MAKVEKHSMQELEKFLPENSFNDVVNYLQKYSVHLTITQHRNSVLGDYKNAANGRNHRISVNGSLNKYSFLITLLHELAHLLTFEKYQHTVAPHGKEWKKIYSQLLETFLQKKIFPTDINNALNDSLKNPGASACSEDGLMRVLKNHDNRKPDVLHVEDLKKNDYFKTRDGRLFQRGDKRRTRYFGTDLKTKKVYLFHGLYEVKKIDSP